MFSKYLTTTVAVDLYFSGSSFSNLYQLVGYLVSTVYYFSCTQVGHVNVTSSC